MRCPILVVLALVTAPLGAQEPPSDPAPDGPRVVFDLERDAADDLLVLDGGDNLRGTLASETIHLQTVYGLVELPAARLAGLDVESGADRVDRAICAGGDAFSGIVLDREFRFVPRGTDQPISIRRERVLRLARSLAATPGPVERHRHVVMRNGDRFGARVATAGLSLRAPYGEFPIDLEAIDRIEFDGGDRAVLRTRAGETLTGQLSVEEILVELDVLSGSPSAPLSLHRCRIDALYASGAAVKPRAKGAPSAVEGPRFDFETGLEGWDVEGRETTWHASSAEAASGEASLECSAPGALAYTNLANTAATSPRLDVSAFRHPVLSFHRRVHCEEQYDFLYVEVTYDDGASWRELAQYSGRLSWERVALPLREGASEIRIRFRFKSDDSEVSRGAWIDDVRLGEP